MKKRLLCISALLLTLASENIFSQKVDAPYEVGRWYGFRTSAISYTFDDNLPNQLAVAVPMFDEYNFKLTLFTVTNWGPNWTGLKKAAANGHEIASHTVSHGHLASVNDETLTNEMKNSQDIINSNITGQKCVTMAYPYCETGKASIVQQYYFASRGCQGFVEGSTPADFNNISSIVCGNVGSVNSADAFKTQANSAFSKKGWCVYLIHAIDNDNGYSPLSSTVLRASLDYLKSAPEKFWVSSFGNVARYIKERNAASVSETINTDNTIAVHVTDTLDNSYYYQPISIRRPLPDGWANCSVTRNGKGVPAELVEINSVKYIVFHVVPDSGDVILDKNGTTGVEGKLGESIPTRSSLEQNYPNPFNPTTSITYKVGSSEHVTLKIYDVLGNEIATLLDEYQQAGKYKVAFNGQLTTDKKQISSGVYFYTLRIGDQYVETKKMILLR